MTPGEPRWYDVTLVRYDERGRTGEECVERVQANTRAMARRRAEARVRNQRGTVGTWVAAREKLVPKEDRPA